MYAQNKMHDLYDVLKVSKNASSDEIRKAFKKMAMEYHPDKNNGNKDSEEMFKKINEAYNILSDPVKKQRYDETGTIDENSMSGVNVDIHDIFKNMFGSGFGEHSEGGFSFMFMDGDDFPFRQMGSKKKAVDIIEVPIDICDIYYGRTKKVDFELLDICEKCNGTGAQDPSHIINCITCKGKGCITQQIGPFFMQRSTCPSCMGKCQIIKKDKLCTACKGEKVVFTKRAFELKLPKGIPNNHEIVMDKKGTYDLASKTHRDILFVFKHNILPPYKLDENMNVTYHISITIEELLAGFSKQITLYKDNIVINSDRYFNPKDHVVLKEKGILNIKRQKSGDLFLKFDIEFIDSDRLSKYNEFMQKILKKTLPSSQEEDSKIIKVQDLL
jgi:molecular chaperone DnaJ